eukprot:CAMPEP_0179857094 /NCGR_PEP_ID=MMETSP0982-20121206/11560_1 /TAXON_ID=483367 /ORGANISM="non described non described, Strain CCMP 2436" /LENGTH=78 /DNA_ID=CAMNT_0021743577 /DNA_START=358 /DNA_END=594 /DNA_ORIENTATION=+
MEPARPGLAREQRYNALHMSTTPPKKPIGRNFGVVSGSLTKGPSPLLSTSDKAHFGHISVVFTHRLGRRQAFVLAAGW